MDIYIYGYIYIYVDIYIYIYMLTPPPLTDHALVTVYSWQMTRLTCWMSIRISISESISISVYCKYIYQY